MSIKSLLTFILIVVSISVFAKKVDPYKPDSKKPKEIKGMKLVWADEFNYTGKPDTTVWRNEKGFVRNQEIQWYQAANATCAKGVLLIEGRRENFNNPNYDSDQYKLEKQPEKKYFILQPVSIHAETNNGFMAGLKYVPESIRQEVRGLLSGHWGQLVHGRQMVKSTRWNSTGLRMYRQYWPMLHGVERNVVLQNGIVNVSLSLISHRKIRIG